MVPEVPLGRDGFTQEVDDASAIVCMYICCVRNTFCFFQKMQ